MNKHKTPLGPLDSDIQARFQAKYDPQAAEEAQQWIETVLEISMTEDNLHLWLRDGVILCDLLNKILDKSEDAPLNSKGKKRKIPSKQIKREAAGKAFICRNNISTYSKFCIKNGMKSDDTFVTNDLYDEEDMVGVINQIFSLGSLAQKIKFNGPILGVKTADENKRTFTEEQLAKGRSFVPLQNAGSIAVEKEKGTDSIVQYGKVGQEMGKASSAPTQQNSGSIAVEKSKGVDKIVKYGKVGQELGKASSAPTQQNSGSIAVEKEKGTDSIVKYGKVGQEMGQSVGGTSQWNEGSIAVEKEKGTDAIVKYGLVGQEMGQSVGGVSQQSQGSLNTSKGKKLDSVSRALN